MIITMKVNDAEYVVSLIDQLLKADLPSANDDFKYGWKTFGDTLKRNLTRDITQDITL